MKDASGDDDELITDAASSADAVSNFDSFNTDPT